MAVRIRYRPNELGEQGVVEVLTEPDSYTVDEDNTVRLYLHVNGKKVPCGFIHGGRWDSIVTVADVER